MSGITPRDVLSRTQRVWKNRFKEMLMCLTRDMLSCERELLTALL